jgi:hypothetical protein
MIAITIGPVALAVEALRVAMSSRESGSASKESKREVIPTALIADSSGN